jgi:metal-sulfur cluster biosynthetic enzyme
MPDPDTLRQTVIDNLREVIDPETGVDVIRMRLVLDLIVNDEGLVNYIFRPSSPLCPIALTLVMEVIEKVKSVPGVAHQKITVVDYAGADELNKILASLNL